MPDSMINGEIGRDESGGNLKERSVKKVEECVHAIRREETV